jgi:predicted  nucleic acid-binding Zn-ribbon protein
MEFLTARVKKTSEAIVAVTSDYGGVEGLEIRHRAAINRLLSAEDQLEAVRKAIAAESKTRGEKDETLMELRHREKGLGEHIEVLRVKNRKIGVARGEVERLQAEETGTRAQLANMQALADQIEAQLIGKGRISVADSGSLPREYWQDDRSAAAVRGAAIGLAPGLLALLAVAWTSRRGRRSVRTA